VLTPRTRLPAPREERHCRFCKQQLPDWKNTLQNGSKQVTPYMRVSFNGKTHKVAVKPGQDGQKEFAHAIRKLLALPEDQEFDVSASGAASRGGGGHGTKLAAAAAAANPCRLPRARARSRPRCPADTCCHSLPRPTPPSSQVIFHCRAPGSGDKLQLQGLCAFDAAVHCASMTSSTSARHTMPKAQRGAEGGSAVQRVVQRVASRLLTMLPSHHSDSLQAAT
jgi:hypothetical protein